MKEKKNEIDMLNGPLLPKLVIMAMPIAAISILQQLFNAADVAVVGRFASGDAIAAVGANTPIINMFVTFFTGLATGGNVAIATLIGRGENKRISKAVHTVCSLSLICALIVIALGEIIAAPLLRLIGTPDNILSQATLYLRIYFVALIFAVVYNFTSAILRSKGDTKRPLYILISSGIINIILNLIFVIGFRLDVAGVAIATMISNIFCAAATVFLLFKESDPFRLSLSKLTIDSEVLKFILRIGLPAGIQGMLFSVSNILIQSGINDFGSACIAGNTAAMNFEFICYFVVNGFAMAATTFISQNYGAGKYERCKKVYREGLALGIVLTLCVSLCFYLGSSFWLGFFTTDSEVLSYAMVRMRWVVLLEGMTAFGEMGSAGLRGMGISLPPTLISITGSCILRAIWVSTIFRTQHTILVLMIVYPVSWVLIAVATTILYLYKRRKFFKPSSGVMTGETP